VGHFVEKGFRCCAVEKALLVMTNTNRGLVLTASHGSGFATSRFGKPSGPAAMTIVVKDHSIQCFCPNEITKTRFAILEARQILSSRSILF
jgi:hypothetical protein